MNSTTPHAALSTPTTLDSFTDRIWKQLAITDKTRKNYIGAYRRYLQPTLGAKELSLITKSDLISAMEELPQQSKYQTLMVARVIFREALERELVSDNPASRIKAPRIEVKTQKFFTWEQLVDMDFGYHTDRIRFLALHGLRYGEAAALTEADIYDGRVHITKSKYGKTKTRAGVRSVPLLYPFTPFPQYQDGIAKVLRPHGVTVHSLRKTYAYTLKNSQVHVTTAAKLMGHANPLVTMKVYTQVLDDEIDKSGEAMRRYLGRAS